MYTKEILYDIITRINQLIIIEAKYHKQTKGGQRVMWKDFLTWLLILFAVLSMPLSVEHASAQENRELRELSKVIKSTSEDIEKLRLSLTNLENKIEFLEQQLKQENIEAKAALKDAKKAFMDAEKKLKDAEVKLNLGEQALDFSNKSLSLPSLLISIVGAVLAVMVALGWFNLRSTTIDKVTKAKEELDSKTEKFEKQLENESKKLNDLRVTNCWAVGLLYTSHSTVIYETSIERAITLTEGGLNYLEEGAPTRKKEDAELTIAAAKFNLAYYYAFGNKTNSRVKAMRYVAEGLPLFQGVENIDWIDCFLFVYSKFAIDIDDKKEWLKIYETYKEEIINYPGIKPAVKTSYEEYYKKI